MPAAAEDKCDVRVCMCVPFLRASACVCVCMCASVCVGMCEHVFACALVCKRYSEDEHGPNAKMRRTI